MPDINEILVPQPPIPPSIENNPVEGGTNPNQLGSGEYTGILTVDGIIQSKNYVKGVNGWQLDGKKNQFFYYSTTTISTSSSSSSSSTVSTSSSSTSHT